MGTAGVQRGLHGFGLAVPRICAEHGETRDARYSWQRRDEKICGRRSSQVLRIPDAE